MAYITIKQVKGAHTTKRLRGSSFVKAYLTVVLSVALGTHTAAPCSFEKGLISVDNGRFHFSSFTLPFHYVGVHTEFFLFSGVVPQISGVLNVQSSPKMVSTRWPA